MASSRRPEPRPLGEDDDCLLVTCDSRSRPDTMTQRRSSNGHRPEQAILAALKRPCQRRWEVEESLEELTGLTQAAGASVVATMIQERETPSPSYYFGKGKVEEL